MPLVSARRTRVASSTESEPRTRRRGALLSFGQDARWRARLVHRCGPSPTIECSSRDRHRSRGSGLTRTLRLPRSSGSTEAPTCCQSSGRDGHIPLVRARAESLPFADDSFDHVTFTYLMRLRRRSRPTMRELARVVRPGGRVSRLTSECHRIRCFECCGASTRRSDCRSSAA